MNKKQITTFSVRQVGKLIHRPIGEKKFFLWLRANGYLLSNNEPAQKHINRGLFILIVRKLNVMNPPKILLIPRVTIKGLAHLQKAVDTYFAKNKIANNDNP